MSHMVSSHDHVVDESFGSHVFVSHGHVHVSHDHVQVANIVRHTCLNSEIYVFFYVHSECLAHLGVLRSEPFSLVK